VIFTCYVLKNHFKMQNPRLETPPNFFFSPPLILNLFWINAHSLSQKVIESLIHTEMNQVRSLLPFPFSDTRDFSTTLSAPSSPWFFQPTRKGGFLIGLFRVLLRNGPFEDMFITFPPQSKHIYISPGSPPELKASFFDKKRDHFPF